MDAFNVSILVGANTMKREFGSKFTEFVCVWPVLASRCKFNKRMGRTQLINFMTHFPLDSNHKNKNKTHTWKIEFSPQSILKAYFQGVWDSIKGISLIYIVARDTSSQPKQPQQIDQNPTNYVSDETSIDADASDRSKRSNRSSRIPKRENKKLHEWVSIWNNRHGSKFVNHCLITFAENRMFWSVWLSAVC